MSSEQAAERSTFEKFKNFFVEPVEPEVPETDDLLEQQKRLARDAERFAETQAYKDFVSDVERAILRCTAQPELGTDVAAALALKQSGLREALAILERIANRRGRGQDG